MYKNTCMNNNHISVMIAIKKYNNKQNTYKVIDYKNTIFVFLFFCSFFFISTQRIIFPVDELRIEVDCSVARDYVEIDAVEIVGGISCFY